MRLREGVIRGTGLLQRTSLMIGLRVVILKGNSCPAQRTARRHAGEMLVIPEREIATVFRLKHPACELLSAAGSLIKSKTMPKFLNGLIVAIAHVLSNLVKPSQDLRLSSTADLQLMPLYCFSSYPVLT